MVDEKNIEIINIDLNKIIDNQNLNEAEWESLVQLGQNAGEIKTYTQWALGKLGDAVMQKYGDLKKYATEIRQEYGPLRQYMSTYRKFIREDSNFHPNKYFGSVPWGVLALAATKSETPQQLVDELQDENKEVSLKAAYREIKRRESPDGLEPPKKPLVKLVWNKNRELYKIVMNSDEFEYIDWSEIANDLKEYLNGFE